MTSLDAHSAEQDLLLNAFHLSQRERNEASADDPWSAAGPSSVSPFVPCAFGRIPAALRAARLTSDDVLWDLGCGDAAAYAYDGWAPGEPNQSARSASLAAAASVRASIEGVAPTVD